MSANTAELGDAVADVTHDLKTWPAYFQPVWDGRKPFDVRLDDRGYQAGDVVALSEWDPAVDCGCRQVSRQHPRTTCTRYTGRVIHADIGYVLSTTPRMNGTTGFEGRGYVVLGLIDLNHDVTTVARTPPRRERVVLGFDGSLADPMATAVFTVSDLRREASPSMADDLRAGHTTTAANCKYSRPGSATNFTCSPCQRAKLGADGIR